MENPAETPDHQERQVDEGKLWQIHAMPFSPMNLLRLTLEGYKSHRDKYTWLYLGCSVIPAIILTLSIYLCFGNVTRDVVDRLWPENSRQSVIVSHPPDHLPQVRVEYGGAHIIYQDDYNARAANLSTSDVLSAGARYAIPFLLALLAMLASIVSQAYLFAYVNERAYADAYGLARSEREISTHIWRRNIWWYVVPSLLLVLISLAKGIGEVSSASAAQTTLASTPAAARGLSDAVMYIMGVSFMLVGLPLFYVYLRLMFTWKAIVTEDLSLFQALSRSWQVTRSRVIRILWALLAPVLPFVILFLAGVLILSRSWMSTTVALATPSTYQVNSSGGSTSLWLITVPIFIIAWAFTLIMMIYEPTMFAVLTIKNDLPEYPETEPSAPPLE